MPNQNIFSGRAWVCGDYIDTYMILPQEHWAGGDKVDKLDPEHLGQYAMEGVDPTFAQAARNGEYQFIGRLGQLASLCGRIRRVSLPAR